MGGAYPHTTFNLTHNIPSIHGHTMQAVWSIHWQGRRDWCRCKGMCAAVSTQFMKLMAACVCAQLSVRSSCSWWLCVYVRSCQYAVHAVDAGAKVCAQLSVRSSCSWWLCVCWCVCVCVCIAFGARIGSLLDLLRGDQKTQTVDAQSLRDTKF